MPRSVAEQVPVQPPADAQCVLERHLGHGLALLLVNFMVSVR